MRNHAYLDAGVLRKPLREGSVANVPVPDGVADERDLLATVLLPDRSGVWHLRRWDRGCCAGSGRRRRPGTTGRHNAQCGGECDGCDQPKHGKCSMMLQLPHILSLRAPGTAGALTPVRSPGALRIGVSEHMRV